MRRVGECEGGGWMGRLKSSQPKSIPVISSNLGYACACVTTHAYREGGEMKEGAWGDEVGRKHTAMMLLLAGDLGKGGERRCLASNRTTATKTCG